MLYALDIAGKNEIYFKTFYTKKLSSMMAFFTREEFFSSTQPLVLIDEFTQRMIGFSLKSELSGDINMTSPYGKA